MEIKKDEFIVKAMEKRNLVLLLLITAQVSILAQQSDTSLSDSLLNELTGFPNVHLWCKSCTYTAFMNQPFSALLLDKDKNLIEEKKSTESQRFQNAQSVSFTTGEAEYVVIKAEKSTDILVDDFISFKKSSAFKTNEITFLPKDRHYFIFTAKSPLVLLNQIEKIELQKKESPGDELSVKIVPVKVRFYLECPHQAVAVVKEDQKKIKVACPEKIENFDLQEYLVVFEEKEDFIKVDIKEKAKTLWGNIRICLYDPDQDKIIAVENQEFKKDKEKPLSKYFVRIVKVKK